MARTAVLGFPRIGPNRELKFALEAYWAGATSAESLLETSAALRGAQLRTGIANDIDVLPVGDFALYDHILDVAELFSIMADRHADPRSIGLDAHFLACRGGTGIAPLEMTKWFDTNYHYLVPELGQQQRFTVSTDRLSKWITHLSEARALGVAVARPVLLGPFSLLTLSKGAGDPLTFLDALTSAYEEVLTALVEAGATEIQLDEPCLVLDQSESALEAFTSSWGRLLSVTQVPVTLATYFGGLDDSVLRRVSSLPIGELHVDLVRAPERLGPVLDALPAGARLSAGVLDGRNVWAAELDAALELLDRALASVGTDRLTIAPSCSLLHVPYSVAREVELDAELRSWLAFGEEKLGELALLARCVDASPAEREDLLASARRRIASRRSSSRANDPAVRARMAGLRAGDYDRSAPLEVRLAAQADRLALPELPTTTIGSYPQTQEIREARRKHRNGEASDIEYAGFLRSEIQRVIREQEELGLDVLVHGEPERNDMVEYFGERLSGFAFSRLGWVQSYGSRAVKPPILYGDVSRSTAMTVDWWEYAQSLTDKPVKGMLTGPVTILQWSFVRDDQPRKDTCLQIALAIHDEVLDLEGAGAVIIQIDEAALREGLPLKQRDQAAYIRWAIDCFRLTAAGTEPETQIHTHMCYSEFEEMIEDIARLDADVISIEASRSRMTLLDAFRDYAYPGQIGPGIWDIHSPRVPSVEELASLLALAEQRIPAQQLWVNPDCGLKTRDWPEVTATLRNLVTATMRRRGLLTTTN